MNLKGAERNHVFIYELDHFQSDLLFHLLRLICPFMFYFWALQCGGYKSAYLLDLAYGEIDCGGYKKAYLLN